MKAGARRFTLHDQLTFADLSGDWNPIHLDPLYARRTIAGQAVVHGVHLLLWALDVAAKTSPGALPGRIVANFTRFLIVGEEAELTIEPSSSGGLQLMVMSGGVIRTDVIVSFRPIDRAPEPLEISGPTFDPERTAIVASADSGIGAEGFISAAALPDALAKAFPAAAAWLGSDRIAAIAATTRLVGMVFPGQNSLFSSLNIALTDVPERSPAIAFKLPEPRHGLIVGVVSGGGIAGKLACLMRQPPRVQPSMEECVRLVQPLAFAGSDALVIGGSRGLGELTAKLIGAGGGNVVLTYATGKAEAERVAAEICEAGGQCSVVPYRVGEAAAPQLALAALPAHIYYFATPTIARPPSSRFLDTGHLAHLQSIFVDGFWDLVSAVAARRTGTAFFYPSTVYIDDRPAGFGEYAMAKAAGEMLCAEINAIMSPTRVFWSRLPRLATDQTVGILGVDATDPASTLLPLIRDVQAY